MGGGCYGTFYAGQLDKAKARGKVDYRTVIVVDRDPECRARRELGDASDRQYVVDDWSRFFDRFLAVRPSDDPADDYIVPSPHMPHLMFEWVLARARARWPDRAVAVEPVPGALGTPYDRTAADHTRYVSFADWICPTHCIEPARCPATGGERTWEMAEAVDTLAQRLRAQGVPVAGPALFVCRHHVFGVGTFSAAAVRAGDALVAETGASGAPAAVLIGTISSCHGALNVLKLGARTRMGTSGRSIIRP
ncbi:MAG: hypothetical protein ACREMN_10525 [Gemmatimonadales bacterium]